MTDSLMGSESSGKGSGVSTQTPTVMTPPAYQALQFPIASQLMSFFSHGGPTYGGPGSVGAPLSNAPQTTTPGTFTAPLTDTEGSILNAIRNVSGNNGGAILDPTSNYLTSVLSPNYLTSALQNPALATAIKGATDPLVSAFQNVTMPNLRGQFVANGQVLNGPAQVSPSGGINPATGQGSSAFDKAAALAQTGLEQSMGATAAPIISSYLTNAMGQQTQGATQAEQLSSTEINNLVQTLQAEALPRLIEQYGMDQGLQEFNNRVNVMLQALGLGVQTSQPDTATTGQSNEKYSNQGGSGFMGSLNQMGSLMGIK